MARRPAIRRRWRNPRALVPLVSLALVLASCARTNPRRDRDGGLRRDGGGADGGVCGDGVRDPGEACDDGNTVPGDGCSPACTLEVCSAATCATGCCDPAGLCHDGTQDTSCGTGGAPCESCAAAGFLCQEQACLDPGTCSLGESLPCGNCGERFCAPSGEWGPCDGQGDCGPGQATITGACGNCGELSRVCQADCTWGGLQCLNEGDCVPGTVEQGASCGTCSREERTCDPATCTWGAWVCVAHQECTPGTTETGATCGNCGHQTRTCDADCSWPAWQCAGEGVCAPGATSTQGCTCGEKTCSPTCAWGTCQTYPEQCNGLDDNCNGLCDDGFGCCRGVSEACTTSCGSQGTRTCNASCAWGACQAPAETCNGVDDDCDGVADEGWRVAEYQATYTALSAYHSTCNGTTERSGQACNQAIHGWCDAQGCPVSGFGPIENTGDTAYVACVCGASVRTVTWATLQGQQPGCNSGVAVSDACYSAYHRYCAAQGYGSGFGPITANATNAQIACVTGVTVRNTDYTTMASKHPGCDGVTQSWGADCNAAIKRYCRDSGHTSGYGPVEHSGNNLTVACLDP